jgi:hypothetical protein
LIARPAKQKPAMTQRILEERFSRLFCPSRSRGGLSVAEAEDADVRVGGVDAEAVFGARTLGSTTKCSSLGALVSGRGDAPGHARSGQSVSDESAVR